MTADAVLVAGICSGQPQAFEALYNKYKDPVFRTALAVTGDRGVAEEVLQDTFVRAFAHAHEVDASTPLSPWLHRIALNLSANRRARKSFFLVPLETLADYLVAGDERSPEAIAERNELCESVQRAIAQLDFKHRSVVVLYYLQGFSLNEIAYILDCPVGTVKSRLHYACATLRRVLAPVHGQAAGAGEPVAVGP